MSRFLTACASNDAHCWLTQEHMTHHERLVLCQRILVELSRLIDLIFGLEQHPLERQHPLRVRKTGVESIDADLPFRELSTSLRQELAHLCELDLAAVHRSDGELLQKRPHCTRMSLTSTE